jgi:DivIVA domain-containing protein
VDQDAIERIRTATFPMARRGYDRREVDRFLASLADWLETGGADSARSDLVRRELERIGEQTARILTEAHDVAERLRAETEAEGQQMLEAARADADEVKTAADRYDSSSRAEADAYAERTKIDADAYDDETRGEADAYAARLRREAAEAAEEVRREADDYAESIRAAAEAQARATVEESHRKRDEIAAMIADLEARRDAVVEDMQRLSSELVGTATQHRVPAPSGDGGEVSPERPAA